MDDNRSPDIVFNRRYRDRVDADQIAVFFLAETAHIVDQYLLTHEQRVKIARAMGYTGPIRQRGSDPGWFEGNYHDQAGEAFMAVFMYAYSEYDPTPEMLEFSHRPTPEAGRLLRSMLG